MAKGEGRQKGCVIRTGRRHDGRPARPGPAQYTSVHLNECAAAYLILFEQIFLDENTEKADYFGESVAPINATRFMAAVKVDVFDAAENRIVWSGRLSRIHNDPTLQPRGNDHKMQGIIDGFGELFADYPIRLDDTQDAYGMN